MPNPEPQREALVKSWSSNPESLAVLRPLVGGIGPLARTLEFYIFNLVNSALADWCENATEADKKALAETFKKKHPDYFVRTTF